MLLWSGVALASVFTHDQGRVLDPASNPLTVNGIGAPTVAYDEDDDLFVMFFETQIDPSTADGCSVGHWAIGAASSPDGVTWTIWDDPVVAPTPGTPYACVAAHPAVVFDGGVFHLWFKAEQGNAVAGSPPWGTANYAGVGYATVDVALDDKTADIAAIDAQITALQDTLDAQVLDYDTSLAQYDTDVRGQGDEFACVSPSAPVCGPCSSVSLSASASNNTVTDTRTFCQGYAFTVPTDVTSTPSALYSSATLSWTTTGGTPQTCTWSWLVGVPFSTTCSAGITRGTSSVTVSTVALQSYAFIGTQASSVTLPATNAQGVSGGLLDYLTTLQVQTAIPDADAVSGLLPGWISQLQSMETWLSTPPVTPDESLLLVETQAVLADAQALQLAISDTATEVAALQAERDVLAAYTQTVDATVLNGVALAIDTTFGYPSVAKLGSTWVMLFQDYPDLYRATASSPDAFTLDANPVITAGTVSWASTEVYEPSMLCTGDLLLPYGTWVAGRRRLGGSFSLGGASDASSSNGIDWFLNLTADFLWANVDSYRHFDVITDDRGELRMYYVQRVGGVNEVHLKSTTTIWPSTGTANRVCP
ncbi:MAG: hypothetical protein H6738_12435 [Alphaproteobacteria bacterium]|nr:hypothetical protein [Alphaproteobacteria bacterium]